MLIDDLKIAGINTDACLAKFLGNEALFTKYAIRFKDDTNFDNFKKALEANDNDLAIHYIHTMKGETGQLGFEDLFEVSNNILIQMRAGNFAYAYDNMERLEKEYYRIKNIVSKY